MVPTFQRHAGGCVSNSRLKTLHLAVSSIEQFFVRNPGRVWFWTFSEPGRKGDEPLWTKDEAEAHFKPFHDLCARKGYELLVVWERQSRGSWHPHCLLNHFIDVNWLRPWMVSRGWGQQMRAEHVLFKLCSGYTNGVRDEYGGGDGRKVVRYLTKYLTKSRPDADSVKKKIFSANARVKVGTTRFRWVSWEHSGARLYFYGRPIWDALNPGEKFNLIWMNNVLQLGAEYLHWDDLDPWWKFSFPDMLWGVKFNPSQ
jgi:hypothetical protein